MAVQTYPVAVIVKLLDLTPRRIRQLVDEGVIPRAERGRYELVPAVRGYIKYLRDRAIGRDGEQSSDIASERARFTREQADRLSMENAKSRGELVSVYLVRRALERTFGAFSARIDAIPQKAVPLLKACSRDMAREKVLRDLVREALDELSNSNFAGIINRAYEDISGGGGNGAAAAADTDDQRVGGSEPRPVPRKQRTARKVEHLQS